MSHRVPKCVLAATWVLWAHAGARGATIVVDPGGGGDFREIQPAIDVAADGDTVLVKPGEYVVAEPIDFNGFRDPEDPESPPAKIHDPASILPNWKIFSHGTRVQSFRYRPLTQQRKSRAARFTSTPEKGLTFPLPERR